MPDVTVDRRKSPRFVLILAATPKEHGTDVKLAARTSDVSRTGCYVDTLTPIPKGKLVHLVLSADNEAFETTGKVIYMSPGLGMGIQFDQPIDLRQLAVLDRWLEKATALRV
jgi:PilZ domain